MEKQLIVTQSKGRLDAYLAEELGLSREKIRRSIKEKLITVNEKASKPAYLVQEGDRINVAILESGPQKALCDKSKDFNVRYLFEDDELVVIYKPSGLLVHEGDIPGETTVVDILKRDGVKVDTPKTSHRPGIVHRLDRLTEGLLVVAKTQSTLEYLLSQFQSGGVDKGYYAMVKGNIMNDDLVIDQPIARQKRQRNKFTVSQDGKPSVTELRVLKRYNTKTLCDITLKTGRTHQIRVHLSYIGHPVLEDPVYGKTKNGKGQLLQAYFLSFKHPKTGERLSFKEPLSTRIKP